MSDNPVDQLPGSSVNLLSRMGERVARLEATQEALKGDTTNIRSSIHSINGELQKVVITQERSLTGLNALTAEVAKIVAASPAIERAVQAFEGMRSDLRTLIEEHHRRDGQHSNMQSVMLFLRGLLPWLVALAALAAWSWEHLSFHG